MRIDRFTINGVQVLFLEFISKLKESLFESVSAFVFQPVVRCGVSLFTFFTIPQATCWSNQILTVHQNGYAESTCIIMRWTVGVRVLLRYSPTCSIFSLQIKLTVLTYIMKCSQGNASFWLQKKNKQVLSKMN